MTKVEEEDFPCPKCGGRIVRPLGASTQHSCGQNVPATGQKNFAGDRNKIETKI